MNNRLTGYRDYRLNNDDPYHQRERDFVEVFKKENGYYDFYSHLCGIEMEHGHPTRQPTEDECRIITTVIQWLGTPVGQSFLHKVEKRHKETGS